MNEVAKNIKKFKLLFIQTAFFEAALNFSESFYSLCGRCDLGETRVYKLFGHLRWIMTTQACYITVKNKFWNKRKKERQTDRQEMDHNWSLYVGCTLIFKVLSLMFRNCLIVCKNERDRGREGEREREREEKEKKEF